MLLCISPNWERWHSSKIKTIWSSNTSWSWYFLIKEDTQELRAIDLDSVYFNTNYPAASYYLRTSSGIKNFTKKYKQDNELGIVYPDENSDLFCYNMMILNNLLARDTISKSSISDYFEYINYLKDK